MNKNLIIVVVLIVLVVLAVAQAVKLDTIGKTSTASTASGEIDTTGWTANEIMNYEMHGTIPARAGSSASAGSSGGMVGGG